SSLLRHPTSSLFPYPTLFRSRVHLASIGYPIVGDRLYGRPPVSAGAPRQLLHACRLVFVHPLTDKRTSIMSSPPADFREFIGDLDRKSTRLNSSHQIISYAVF